MWHVSICIFKLEPCVCGYPGNARTVTSSPRECSWNSLAVHGDEERSVWLQGVCLLSVKYLASASDPLFAPVVQPCTLPRYPALFVLGSGMKQWSGEHPYKLEEQTMAKTPQILPQLLISDFTVATYPSPTQLSHTHQIAQEWYWENHDIPAGLKQKYPTV